MSEFDASRADGLATLWCEQVSGAEALGHCPQLRAGVREPKVGVRAASTVTRRDVIPTPAPAPAAPPAGGGV